MHSLSTILIGCLVNACFGALTFKRGEGDQISSQEVYKAVKWFVKEHNKLSGHSNLYVSYEIGEVSTSQISEGVELETSVSLLLSRCSNVAGNEEKTLEHCKPDERVEVQQCNVKITIPAQGQEYSLGMNECQRIQYKRHCKPDHVILESDHKIGCTDEFEEFRVKYGKVYKDEAELNYRRRVFEEGMKCAFMDTKTDLATAVYGMTKYSDWTVDEFRATHKLNPVDSHNVTSFAKSSSTRKVSRPASLDYRSLFLPCRLQNPCGNCWAFSACGTVEGVYAKLTGKKAYLSVQELVDCNDMGTRCQGGGSRPAALNYIKKTGKIGLDSDYPYIGGDTGKCNRKNTPGGVTVTAVNNYGNDANAIADGLFEKGPLAPGFNADTITGGFQGGIMQPPGCSQQSNHAVVMAGYGSENGVDFWLIRNSWGPDWNPTENGYFRIKRGANTCGIEGNSVCGCDVRA